MGGFPAIVSDAPRGRVSYTLSMVLASRRRVAYLLAAALWSILPPAASAQYEQRFGEPVDVRLDDLIQNPEQYAQRAVRTKGRLDISNEPGATMGTFVLKGSFQGSARIVAAGAAAAAWDSQAR